MRDDGLLGREAELDELLARLGDHRLVTIVGPGGVGKTTLAREAARRVSDRFPLGVRVVDLTRVDGPNAPEAVAGSFAAQLGFASFEALLGSPVEQPALVLVDNCEHVLDAAADAASSLLAACTSPVVLATSRSPLDLPGESVIALAPLAVPGRDDPAAADSPAVRLFLRRARDAGATLSERDLDLVVRLCARLDGLPLAIEIAAARARHMSLTELLARVEEGIAVLDRPRFRGPPRHRSVAEVIAWSTDRLRPEEVDLLERLAVPSGDFTLDTARRLSADPSGFDAALDELLNASLVSADTRGQVTRYRLLDVVRRFALSRLAARGDLADRHDRLVDEVVTATRRRLHDGGMAWGPAALREAVAQLDDVAAAIRWCVDHDHGPERALSLCASLLVIIEQGRADEIVALARRVFARWPDALASGAPRAAEAMATLANGENLVGDPEAGMRLAEGALATVTEPALAAVTLRQAIGDCAVALGQRRAARDAYAAAATIARGLGLTSLALELEIGHAQLAADDGEGDAALARIDAARAEATALGATLTALWASVVHAWLSLRRDLRSRRAAAAAIDAALAACVEAGFPNGIAASLRALALRRSLDDDSPGAVAALEALRREIIAQRSLANLRMLVDAAAALAHRAGHPSWERFAATIDTLPPATLLAARGSSCVALPATDAAPLAPRDALEAVHALLVDLQRAPAAPAPAPVVAPGAPERASMRLVGDGWELTFGGLRATARTSKGLQTIARLVATPGRQHHCLDLMGAAVTQASTGEVLDAAARRSYEARIRDLQAEVDEAEAANDFTRAERAQAELGTLVDALAAALGAGGKARRPGDTVDRARSALTHRIRSAIQALDEVHPPLARHLRRAITTGTRCAYEPEQPVLWDVEA